MNVLLVCSTNSSGSRSRLCGTPHQCRRWPTSAWHQQHEPRIYFLIFLAVRSQRCRRFRESRLCEKLPCEKAAAQINPNTKNPSCCSELPRAIKPPQPSTGADILISLKSSRITQRGSNFLFFPVVVPLELRCRSPLCTEQPLLAADNLCSPHP